MSDEQKRQSMHDEPKQDVQPERELTDEELDQVAGGNEATASPVPPDQVARWNFIRGWPRKISGPSLNSH